MKLNRERELQQEGADFQLPADAEGGDAFILTLHKLMVTLRELHHAVRVSCDYSLSFDADIESLNKALGVDSRSEELVPVYIDSAFTYLRSFQIT